MNMQKGTIRFGCSLFFLIYYLCTDDSHLIMIQYSYYVENCFKKGVFTMRATNCPRHNSFDKVKKISIPKTKKYPNIGTVKAYYCKKCDKYYTNIDEIIESRIGYIANTPVYNIHRYYLPNEINVLTSKSLSKLSKVNITEWPCHSVIFNNQIWLFPLYMVILF